MSEQTDTPTVHTLGFSEWSAENDYTDPLESRLKFGDYVREEFIKADAYTPDVEIGVRRGLSNMLREDGLLEPDGANAEELEQRMADIQRGKTFDQLARTFQQSLPEHGEDQQTLNDYFAAAVESPSPEYAEELQPLREKADDVVNRNRDQLLQVKVDAGELPMARLSNGQLIVGEAAAQMDLVGALKASSEGGVTMGDALAAQAQLDTPDGFSIPLYRIQRLAQATRLLEVERKQNADFDIQIDGLSTEAAQSEYSTMDWLEHKADNLGRGLKNFFGRVMGQGEDIDKAEARREAVNEARGSDIRQIASKYALKFDIRPEDMELAVEQMVLDNAVNKQMFEFHDEDDDDVGKNLRIGGYGLPTMSMQAMVNKDVFDKTLAANPELSEEVKTMLNKQRIAHLRSDFTRLDTFLSASNVSDEWGKALIVGRTAGVEDYKILEGFVADKDNYNEFAERAAGVGMSFLNGVGQLFAAIPAAFGFDPAQDYLASVSQKNADRRQLAAVFGEEFGLLQDATETAFPMLIDIAATTLLAAATAPAGGAGGVAYASLKAGGTTTASMTAKGMFKSITSNVFRKTGAKSTVDQAEDLLAANLIKGSKEGAIDILNAYNSKLSAHLGNLPAIFIPAATRSGSATYGAVYNQLKQNPDVSDDDAHDRALGAMLMAGTFTGVLTAAFSAIGRGGMEDALLRGLSTKQMKRAGEEITGKLGGNLLSSAEKSIKKIMKRYAFGGVKGLAKSVFDEGIEEGIDEFVNGLVTDAALHEDTPMLERLQQTWHAFVLGGIMGGSVPLVQRTFRALQPDVLREREKTSFYEDVLEEMSTDLTENGAPITAEVVNMLVSDMRRKDARASVVPTLEEQEALLRGGEPEATEEGTQLPSGITPDPEAEALFEEKVNPDSAARAVNNVLGSSVPVVSGSDPTTVEAKGNLMHQLELPIQEASSLENSDHQAVRNLTPRRTEGAEPDVFEGTRPPKKKTIINPARAEEAEAIEVGFREIVQQIDEAEALYKKMDQQVAGAEVAGESSVRRALEQRVREGKAVSPEQATELRGEAFKDRVLALKDLKVEQTVELEEVTEDPSVVSRVEALIEGGYPHMLTAAKLRKLGVPITEQTTSAAFLRSANDRIASEVEARFPRIPVTRPEGGMALDSAYGRGKVFLDRVGRGQFNNDPLTMLSLFETGAPIVVDPAHLDSPTLNPAFRFARVGNNVVVSDIMVPESGGLVSVLTPIDRALVLKPDYTRIVKLVERVITLRDDGLREPDAMIDSPFEPNTQMTAQEVLTQLEEGVGIDGFVAPNTGELAPEFAESAQIELRLRAQEALFTEGKVSLVGLGREVADLYMVEQTARLKHSKESFVASVSVNEAADLQADPDFNAASEVEDTYTPFPENAPPPFSESSISNLLNEAHADAVAALDGDSNLRQSVVLLVQNEVFNTSSIDFNRTSTKRLWGYVVQWMAQGSHKTSPASIEFQKALRGRQFEMGAPVREALQLMALSSASVEGTPKTDAAYRAFLRDKIRGLKGGAEPSDAEVFSFHNHVRGSVGALLLRSQPSGMSKAHDQMVNKRAIAALGLKDGDPESIIEALERIVGVSDRVQKEYDSHLVSVARLLLQSPEFIRSVELSIDETDLNYAGKFDTLTDGTPAISININGHNPRGVADTLVHELIHAYVTGVTRKPAAAQTRQETAAIGLLEGVIADIRADYKAMSNQETTPAVFSVRSVPDMGVYKYHDTRVYDALTNVDEFVAHFLTSADFQKFVKTMLADRAAPALYSRFEQVVAAIRAFFRGANPEFDSAFSAVLDLSHSSVLAAGARRRSKRDLISVEEFLNLPNKESRTAKDFVADSVFPTDPATNSTTPKEPVTVDAIVGKIAEDVSRSQQEAVRLSSGIQEATGVDVDAQQRGQASVERLMSFIRNRVVPPEMRVEVDLNHPTMMSVDSEAGTLVVNPLMLSGLLTELRTMNGGRPVSMRTQMNIIAVIANEEIAHAASVATITRAERDELIDGMTDADAEETMSNYGDEGNVANRERLLEGWRNGDRAAQVEIMEEMLRQHAQKVTRGFTTEEDVAFLRRNPNLVQTLVRYFQRFLKKLGYYRSRRNISPQLRTAVDRVVNEIRALEAGYRHSTNLKPFDPNNPESVIEQFRKQANMNKPIERADEPREAEPALASGITVEQAQVPADAGDVLDARDWTKVGPQLGSNMGGVYEDGEGNKFYFKESKTTEHARNEVLATILYETAGADILPIRLATGKDAAGQDVLGTASKWREDFTDFDPRDPAMRKSAYPDFAIHAWLANWDVVGLVYDNLMVDGDGRVVHVDTGGALKFRAQGEPKGGAWNEEGSEFATLRVMGQAGEVFGGMSTTDLQNSAAQLRKMTDETIQSAVEGVMGVGAESTEMADTLIARRDNILNVAFDRGQFVSSGITLQGQPQESPQETVSLSDFEFDGVFPEDLEYLRTNDGKFRGAPPRVTTEKDVENLEERLKNLTIEGAVGRYWYEDAAEKILEITNGDVVEAEKLIALLAIYSPQTGVEVNTYFAVRAYEQHANNVSRRDFSVKTAVQDNKARAVLYDNRDWTGRKTDNFYKNIMFHIVQQATPEQLRSMRIDTAFLEKIQQPVTVDMWVYRAMGYDTIGLTDEKGKGAFGFSEKMINRLTHSLNQNLAEGEPRYEAHQVQAMVWTAIKARSEQKEVKQKTEAESIAEGDMVRERGARGQLQRSFPNKDAERRHQRRWTENALAATGVDFVEASRSFDYFVDSMGLTATWEVIASTKTEIGQRLAAMTPEEKREFTEQAMQLIVDPETGEDLLAKELGIAVSVSKMSVGGYEGGVAPNVLSTLYPNKPKDVGGKETYDDDAIRAYARALQYIFMQDAVPWLRVVKKTKQDVFYRVTKGGRTVSEGAHFESQEDAEAWATLKNERIDTGKVVKVDDGYQIQTNKDKPYRLKNKDTGKLEAIPTFKQEEEAENFRADNLIHTAGGNEQSYGIHLTFSDDLTESKLQEIQDDLTSMHPDLGFTQVDANQIIVVNFKMDYMNMLPVLTDDTFADKIIRQYEQEAELETITTVGEYGYHDWEANQEGDQILTFSPRFTPTVQEGLRDRRQRFQRISGKRTRKGAKLTGRATKRARQAAEHLGQISRREATQRTGQLASGITVREGDEDAALVSESLRQVFEPHRDRTRRDRDRVDAEEEEPAVIKLRGFPEQQSWLDRVKKAPQIAKDERVKTRNLHTRLQEIDREFFALESRRKEAGSVERAQADVRQRELILEVARLRGYAPSMYHGTARKMSVKALFAKHGISHVRVSSHGKTKIVMQKWEDPSALPSGVRENIEKFVHEHEFKHRYPFEVYRGATGDHYTPATGLIFLSPREMSAESFAHSKRGHLESKERMMGAIEELVLPTFVKADKIFDPREDWRLVEDLLNKLRREGHLSGGAVYDADELAKPFHLPPKSETRDLTDHAVKASEQAEDYYKLTNGSWYWWERPEVIDAVFDMGYDAILVSEHSSTHAVEPDERMNLAVRDPAKIKTAHARTYDKDGNLIPPSKRFEEGKDAHMYSGITTQFGWTGAEELTAEQTKELEEIQKEHDSILNEYKHILDKGSQAWRGDGGRHRRDVLTGLTQTEEVRQGYLWNFVGEEGFGFTPDTEAYETQMGEFQAMPDVGLAESTVAEIAHRLQPLVNRAAEISGWSQRHMYHGTSHATDIPRDAGTERTVFDAETGTERPVFDTFDPTRSDYGGEKGLVFFSPRVAGAGAAEEFIGMQEGGGGHAMISVVTKSDMNLFDPRVNWEEFMDEMTMAYALRYLGPEAEGMADEDIIQRFTDDNTAHGPAGVTFMDAHLSSIKDGYWVYWEKSLVTDAILAKYDGMLIAEESRYGEAERTNGLVKDEYMNLALRNPSLVKSVAPVTLDSEGEIVPLSERFNPASPAFIHSGITFGAASDLPSEFNSEGVDYSQFIEVLEMPFIEKGPFQKVKGTWRKLFKGETDPTVQRYVRQRDSFIRTTDKVVEEYHSKYKSALEEDYDDPNDIPWDDIQAATGTTDNIDPDPDNVLLDARNKEKDAAHAQYQADLATEYAKHRQDEDAEKVKIDAAEPDLDKRKPLYRAAADARRAKQRATKDALGTTKGAADEAAQQKYEAAKDKSFETKKADMIKDRNEAFDRLRATAPNLFPVLLDLRRLTDELSKEAKKLFGVFSAKDLSVKFDNNMGLYVTRRYHMFSDTDYVERILTSESANDKAIRDTAIDFMRDQFIKFEYDKFRASGRSDSDARAAAEALYDSREQAGQSLGYQMARDFLQSYETETGPVDFASAFDLAGKPASLPARMSDSLKALTKNLEGRAEIPKPLADLMGANNVPEDSVDSLLYTLGTVSKIAAHQSFLNKMRQQGEVGGWLMTHQQKEDALKNAKTKEEFDRISSMRQIISSGADSGLNPLAGMWVDRDVHEDIRPMFQQTIREPNDASSRALHNAMTYAQKATGFAMAAKTLGSVGFYLRNMLSNVLFFGPAQGYWGAGKSLVSGNPTEGTGMSALMATGRAFKGNAARSSAYLRELESLGVFGDEVRSEIMLKLMQGEETFVSLEDQLQKLNKKAATAKGFKALQSIQNTAARLGSAMDSFYKIGYYEHELAVIEKAAEAEKGMPKGDRKYSLMSPMQRKQHAADIISATAQSYARALPVIKKISGSSWGLLVAPFIRFTAEVPRIAVNTFTLARKEIHDANPVIKSRGRQRMSGLGLVAAFSTAMPVLLQKLLSDMGEDEDEAFRMSLPPYLRNHTFYYFRGDKKILGVNVAAGARALAGGEEGDLTTFDLTYLNPFAVIADPFLRGMEHLVRGEPMVAAEKIITASFLEPYLGDQILAGSIIDVKENRDARSGRPIYEESDPLWRKTAKMVGYVGKEAYGPRTPMKFHEAWKAAGGEVDKFADSPFGIIMSEFYPVRPRSNDPADQFSRVVYQLRDEQRRVQQRFNKLKQTKGMGEGEVRSIHRDIRKSRMRINSKLAQAMRGFNGLGVNNYDLYQQLRGARYGERRSKLLFAGFMENPVPTTDLVETLMKTPQGQQRLKWLMDEHSENPRFLKLDD